MNGESQIEVFLSIFVLGLATAFATDYVHLPYELVQSPIFVAIFLIVTLIAFPMFPMTAISLFFLLTIILFSRNLETTMSRAHTPKANVPYEQVHRLNNSPTMPPRPNWYSATVETHPVTEQPSQLMTGSTVYGEKSIPEHTVPVAAPGITIPTNVVPLLETTMAAVPPMVNAVVELKSVPVIVTSVPTGPDDGLNEVIAGAVYPLLDKSAKHKNIAKNFENKGVVFFINKIY